MEGRLRRLLLGAIVGLASALVIGLGIWLVQRSLIYFPDASAPSVSVMGPGWEEVELATADGLTLQAWYRKPDADLPVVIVLNGNAGNRAGRASLGRGFAAAGFGVLLTDYRGYGGNPGRPTETGIGEDARAALAFTKVHAPSSPIVYFGESLGTAVAVDLAHGDPPAALILRSPFTSLVAVGRVHYPWLPVGIMLKDRYELDQLIGTVSVPTLVIAGDADSIVPYAQSLDVYNAAPGDKRLVTVVGADHNDPELVSGPMVIREATSFITEMIDR